MYALREEDGRQRLATTNSIEHDHMAVRRRTRVIRVFPNESSFLRLASALASERNEKWMVWRYVTAQKRSQTTTPKNRRITPVPTLRSETIYTQIRT